MGIVCGSDLYFVGCRSEVAPRIFGRTIVLLQEIDKSPQASLVVEKFRKLPQARDVKHSVLCGVLM